MNNSKSDWNAGHVGWFVCLHEETSEEVDEGYREGELIRTYRVQGKERPCLILRKWIKGYYFLVWRLSSEAYTPRFVELRSLCRYGGDRKPVFLRTEYPNEICWIHQKLARGVFGKVADSELKSVLDQWRAGNGYGPPV
jgi:hypothetical protein